ncbi:hypothetical protein PsYK624_159440 [Phanerochaete sordida]|uniref:Senescence domain-containing protein n=1 Tax=Phanerochaete sordida TaxID=48140 RepID=A0A9P3LLG4_9APHY|nr:hypothetical protein PsYK624_159440 [Phanerochaete sordida]
MSESGSPPLVTIPGCTATHVLGTTSTEIGNGDLTLVPPPRGSTASDAKRHVLTLTVGKAAFPLHSSTDFGTVAGDERIYVFKPDLGADIQGYVRLTLPDGVRQSHSGFQMLQAQFETILINHELLRPAERPNERSVTIPNVAVIHVVGNTSTQLASGELTLMTVSALDTQPENDSHAVLTLTIGNAVFPLHKTTVFGTLAESDRTYVFNPEIGQEGMIVVGGYVKIVLPEEVSSNKQIGQLQEQFEQVLIDYGLLKEGVEAVGDELGRSVRESGASIAGSIRAKKREILAGSPATQDPASFSPTTHSVASGTTSATQTVYSAAQTISTSVSSAAASASAWFSSKLGPASPSTVEPLNAAGSAYDAVATGISGGAAEVKGAATEAVGDIVEHDHGKEARQLGGQASESAGNVGATLGQVAEVGTGAAIVAGGVKGAVAEENKKQQEMDVFKIEEKDDSGEWNDVPV